MDCSLPDSSVHGVSQNIGLAADWLSFRRFVHLQFKPQWWEYLFSSTLLIMKISIFNFTNLIGEKWNCFNVHFPDCLWGCVFNELLVIFCIYSIHSSFIYADVYPLYKNANILYVHALLQSVTFFFSVEVLSCLSFNFCFWVFYQTDIKNCVCSYYIFRFFHLWL